MKKRKRFDKINSIINLFLLIVVFSVIAGFTIPKKLEKKVRKQINNTFNITDYTLKNVIISTKTITKVITNTNFYTINKDKLIGYAILDKANSKITNFDYLVLLNTKLEIVNIKILIYRESHGGEISSKRWLRQFFGLGINNHAKLQDNIDGISGATISVRSMTTEIDLILKDLKLLVKNNEIK